MFRDNPLKFCEAPGAVTSVTATRVHPRQRAFQALDPIAVALWQAEFRHYRPLIERIIAQAERRVLHGEAVPASEKIVSLFRAARRHHRS
jgi:transposase, IS5 family